jgi:hypothetical protein
MPATCRAPRRAVPLRQHQARRALHRETLNAGDVPVPLDVPYRCAGTDAGSAIGREALDAGTAASGASIKPGAIGKALHREARAARCRLPRWPGCLSGRGRDGCFRKMLPPTRT